MEALTVGFEGLHRSGKGTQMKLLKDYLNNKLIDAISIRGEYYRKGVGNGDSLDPYSERWQNNWADDSINYEKSQRINREIRILFNKILPSLPKGSGNKYCAVLFDRTIFSRYFIDSLFQENLSFENVKYIYAKSGKFIEKIVPEIIFVFKCDKDVLLQRLASDELSAENLIYKEKFIKENTDKFNKYIETIRVDELKTQLVTIDGNASPQEIHKDVIQYLNPYINTCIGK